MLKAAQIQRIYGMGATLNMIDKSKHKDDMLHNLVYDLTGKDSIKQLDYDEYKTIVAELSQRIKISQMEVPPARAKSHRAKKREDTAKGMTEGQQRKVWALMYQLINCDIEPVAATKGERLCGIIKKELHIDARPKDPFIWLGFEDGNKLIEVLKAYIRSTKRKATRRV